jgi:hypothetical protein
MITKKEQKTMKSKIKSTDIRHENFIKNHYLKQIMYTALETHALSTEKYNSKSILNNLNQIKSDTEFLIKYLEKMEDISIEK